VLFQCGFVKLTTETPCDYEVTNNSSNVQGLELCFSTSLDVSTDFVQHSLICAIALSGVAFCVLQLSYFEIFTGICNPSRLRRLYPGALFLH